MYLVSIAPMRRRWRIQHGGYAWESRRKSEEEALCIRYVHLSGRLQSMCDIVLGVEIERALRAIQRDEGWNCKGAHSATIAIPGLGE